MKLSIHAEQRCQMRGIPKDCYEILLRHGTPHSRPGGATAYRMTEKDRLAAMDDCRRLFEILERSRDAAIILGDDGICVTAYKKPKRFRRE